MAVFVPGTTRTAKAKILVNVSGLQCQAELFIGPNDATKLTTSGKKDFVSNVSGTDVSFPIVIPSGENKVFIDVYYQGVIFLAFEATETVTGITGSIEPPVWS